MVAGEELKRAGFVIAHGENERSFGRLFGEMLERWSGRRGPRTIWHDQVALTAAQVETLDPFASALLRHRPPYVALRKCPRLRDVNALRSVPDLQAVEIVECPQVTDFTFLEALENLSFLYIADAPALDAVPATAPKEKLTLLILNRCSALKDFSNLRRYTQLKSLSLVRSRLQNTEDLRGLHQLDTLVLNDCEQLSDLRGLHELKQLTWIRLSGCKSLPEAAVTDLKRALPQAAISNLP